MIALLTCSSFRKSSTFKSKWIICCVLNVTPSSVRLTAATMATVDQLQLQTRAGLEYVLKKRKVSMCCVTAVATAGHEIIHI